MKIAIVGTGYVGLVTGVCLAEVGHSVVCVDKDQKKIDTLKNAQSPIFEPGIENLIRRNIEHERLTFTDDLASAMTDATCVFIAVGTPQGEDGSADLQYVLAVAKEIGATAQQEIIAIVKSTVPVGTCQKVENAIKQELSARKVDFEIPVASNPEFLKEGAAISDFMRPERIIVGFNNEKCHKMFKELYRPFVIDDPGKLIAMDRTSSELSKYGANSMLATRISFMNELSRLCERVGANIDNVRLGMGSDSRIGRKFLYAGPGYGGSCFPKDVKALIHTGREYDMPQSVLESVSQANKIQTEHVIKKILGHYDDIKGKTIGIWGLTFKPNTDDVRETPAAPIIEALLEAGAKVKAHDPQGRETFHEEYEAGKNIEICDSAYKAIEGVAGVVLVTEWPEYKRPNWEKAKTIMSDHVVFDFRNQYNFDDLKDAGFHYYAVGRPDHTYDKN